MKVIAMYLPQFHRVRENDEWWGEGFTEWTTVRNARPLHDGHEQPKVPFKDNYYDLMSRCTMEWQAELMKKYKVDGICMYHYWFRDGRKILEKPSENLLEWTEIDMPFCFCWANETWARSWSNVREKNTWADTYENNDRRVGDGVLLEQSYGEEQQWIEHFDYLLPFFRDTRYITVDGKPLIVIYRASAIPCLREMVELWRTRALESGLKGLYVIGVWIRETDRHVVDAVLCHEPVRARFSLAGRKPNGMVRLDYDAVWNNILELSGKENTFFGGFVSYDDTPRRGKDGCLIEGGTPDKFACYLTELMAKNEANGKDIVFLNAWNEWGEGMYLEPDARERYGYLEKIADAKARYRNRIEYYRRSLKERRIIDEQAKTLIEEKNKFEHYLNLLDSWMVLREKGICLVNWIIEKGYRNIGIYGYGTLGKHLVRELENSEVVIRFIVDQEKEKVPVGMLAFLPEEQLPEADVLVVTATFYYDDIYHRLKGKGIRNIVSLERIIGEC